MTRGVLSAREIDPEVVYRAQKRILVPSGDLRSRYRAARLVGYPAKPPRTGRFRLRSLLTHSLLLANDRLSKTRWGPRLLARVPRFLLYGYIAALKLINNSLRPGPRDQDRGDRSQGP
jgi:hypothetical protein